MAPGYGGVPMTRRIVIEVERLMPHTSDGRGDLSCTFPGGLSLELEVPDRYIIGPKALSLEGLAYVNTEIKKALHQGDRSFEFWRSDSHATKSKKEKKPHGNRG